MPDTESLAGFVAAALVILLIPGPGVLYILARSLGQGRRAGLVSVLGLSAGALVHVAAATAGLSAVLLASATAFAAVKFLGAAYLIYLGLRTLLSKTGASELDAAEPRALRRVFRDGVLVSVLNPKIAVFFLAFLPQFVDTASGPATQQVLVLGLLYVALAMLTDGAYALLAGTARQWIGGRMMTGPMPRYAAGCLYIGLGVSTALSGRRAD
jgi:threonine/homoserine/homoserine lactone efflux protein